MHQSGQVMVKKQFLDRKLMVAPEETETEASATHLSPAVQIEALPGWTHLAPLNRKMSNGLLNHILSDLDKINGKSQFPPPQKDAIIAGMDIEQDTYWQETTNLFTGTFSYFKNNGEPQPVPVHAKIHRSIEEYHSIETEIVPIKSTKGERIYFHIQPYVEEPNIILTVGMPPDGYADTDAIGKVQESRVEGFRQTPIGKCQAWYYPADTTVLVWECFLDRAFRGNTQPTEDPNMQKLWQTIEKYFARKFPRADRIVTPFDDPQLQREAYQTFLRSLGYEPVAKAAYGKLL